MGGWDFVNNKYAGTRGLLPLHLLKIRKNPLSMIDVDDIGGLRVEGQGLKEQQGHCYNGGR